MKQLNTYRFYELGAKLHSLFCEGDRHNVADMFLPLTEAQTLLDGFIKGDVFALDSSKADAVRLLNKIGSIFDRYYIDAATKQLKAPEGTDSIDPHELSLVRTLTEKFEHALAAELNHVPAYVAGKRGIYSTHDLAENARRVFSDDQRQLIPLTVLEEIDVAGRALAFSLGTATTVHLLRATEIMLKLYFDTFVGSAGAKGERNYAIYLKKLAALSEDDDKEKVMRPDRRIIQALAQVKENYRNPLLMPECSFTTDDATLMFGAVTALIAQMAEQIQAKKVVSDKMAGRQNSSPEIQAEDEDDVVDFRLSQAG